MENAQKQVRFLIQKNVSVLRFLKKLHFQKWAKFSRILLRVSLAGREFFLLKKLYARREGNVKIVSVITGDRLFTEKIILYNTTQSVISRNKVLFINGGDSLQGIGFWSDFDMENWKIEKPIGSITKDEE